MLTSRWKRHASEMNQKCILPFYLYRKLNYRDIDCASDYTEDRFVSCLPLQNNWCFRHSLRVDSHNKSFYTTNKSATKSACLDCKGWNPQQACGKSAPISMQDMWIHLLHKIMPHVDQPLGFSFKILVKASSWRNLRDLTVGSTCFKVRD